MKPQTRDNLIYLAVGVTILALVVADTFYSLDHDRKAWEPSRFAFRAVATTSLLAYFAVRETRKAKATQAQALGCALLASFIHLGIIFGFRQTVEQLPGISFSSWLLWRYSLLSRWRYNLFRTRSIRGTADCFTRATLSGFGVNQTLSPLMVSLQASSLHDHLYRLLSSPLGARN